VVVEHDEDTMRRADWILDLGPGAGVRGGQVVAEGTLQDLLRHPDSVTGRCLREQPPRPARGERRPVEVVGVRKPRGKSAKATASAISVEWLTVHRARLNNLKDVTASFPLGRLVVVTGVSGSGKSTLVKECLVPGVRAVLAGEEEKKLRGLAGGVSGLGNLRAVHEVDQTPIGRTPRSTPATYVGFFDDIRALFAQVPEARMRGYGPGRFSFNSSQGRCPHCEGAGVVKMEMNFLPTASVGCEACGGQRFNAGTLEIRYQGKSIAEVLQLSVAEGIEFFAHQMRLRRPLEALRDTGL
jgi:excinuclease ABC subunit A